MEINICAAGFGGQGVMTLGKFLAAAVCSSSELNVTFFPSYGAEQRGGTANCFVVISNENIGAPVADILDDLIVLNQPSLDKFAPRLKLGGRLFINTSLVNSNIDRSDIEVVGVPATELSLEMDNPRAVNLIMLGAYIGYCDIISEESVWQTVAEKFSKKPEALEKNRVAFYRGIEIGKAERKKNIER